jgi:amino acid permease
MSSDEFELLTRESVLEGLFGGHEKRASTLLVAIESRTAHLVAQSKQAMERFLTEEAAEERELAFLEALALGRELPLRPTIQDLERYAPQWASLVPENPRAQAAAAHLLGQKYEFTYQAVPGIRAALGLDEEAVQQAYQRLYHQPLETIFAPQAALADRLRWAWAGLAGWLESLPPFWTAFALTLTETVGAGILALPIALAGIGPLAGVVVLVVLGLVNVLTIAYMAEAVARSGTIRYGSAFIGQVVTDYLGRAGALILSLGLITICFLALWSYYIGFSAALADATRIPAPVWVALLFLIGLYFLRRESLSATIASALLVGAVNIGLILILSLLAFTHLRPANLLYVNVPFFGGRPFEPSILQLIFGVVLAAYFGHLSLSNCARVVLHRDPSARALVWGTVASQVVTMALYCLWVLVVNGAIAPQELAGQSGTVLAPLAAEIGPLVHVLGSVFVVLGMGMASIHFSLGLFNLVREWLPTKPRPVVILPRRRGSLLLRSNGMASANGELRLALTYLGLDPEARPEPGRRDSQGASPEPSRRTSPEHGRGDGQPRFRLDIQVGGATHHLEMAMTGSWEATALFDQLPVLRQHEWDTASLSMADVLALPDSQQEIVTWMIREEMTGRETVNLADVATYTGQSETVARTTLNTLVEQGFVQELEVDGETRYRPRLMSRRGRQLSEDIWQALRPGSGQALRPGSGQALRPGSGQALGEEEAPAGGGPEAGFLQWAGEALLGERGRFFLSVAPVAVVFLLTEWALLTERGSFAGPLSFLGVIVISLLGGIFPVLLLIASRRKGEVVPGVVYRFLGHPVLTAGVYLLYLAGLLLHGLVIWENPGQRAVALVVGVMMLGVTIALVRRGSFAPRLVVELRQDQSEGGRALFNITVGGQSVPAAVRLGYPDSEKQHEAATGEVPAFSSLRYAKFQLPAIQARDLKVWAHKITPEGNSEGLPALLEVHRGHEKKDFDLKLSGGQVVLPLEGQACRLAITLPESRRT